MASFSNSVKKNYSSIVKKNYYNIVPFRYRYGKVFHDEYKFLMKSLQWDKDRLLEFQEKEFKKLIHHCYTNVPYYTKVFNERGLKPSSFQTVEDIKLLPFLTKDIIRDNLKDLSAINMRGQKVYEFRTSGSTGKKLVFYGTDDVYKKEAAFVLRAYKTHGATLYDKPSVWLRRYTPKEESSPLWYTDYELRRLYMSAYHLNGKTVHDYVKTINSGKYHTLVGYPSSIYILACLCEESNISLDNIKAIHTASEKMLPQWKTKIEKVFNIVPKMHYGMQERVCFHHQPGHTDEYYENLEYGVTEFVETDGQQQIVGTGFLNYYMPFLRYKMSDTAILSNNDYPYRIRDINGRCDDILVSKDGCRLPGVNFYTMMYKIDGVKMFRIVQRSYDKIDFYLVPNEKYNKDTNNEIMAGLAQRLGDIDVNIVRTDELQRQKETGKIRCIFNEIKD